MTKPNKVKKSEKGVEECEKFAEAIACEDEAKSTPTTNEDLMSAISALNKTVDQRLGELSSALSNVSSALTDMTARVEETEEAVQAHEGRIESLERLNAKMATETALIQAKLEDLESRSRRHNIRIMGIKEKLENGKPSEFVSSLLPELLGQDNFDKPIQIDMAHRSARPAAGNRPRAIITRLHHLQVKELVLRLARQKAPLRFKGDSVQIYPDLTSGTMKKRQDFNDVRNKCKERNIRCGFKFPAKFIVTVGEETKTFEMPSDTEKFLMTTVPKWKSTREVQGDHNGTNNMSE